MLKNMMKSFIIKKIVVITGLCVVLSAPLYATDSEDYEDFSVKPLYVFKNKGGRDPFSPRFENSVTSAMESVNIATFVLEGITISDEVGTALFRSKSGESFGYIFMDGYLYGDNETVIPDISGEVKNENEVVLRQGDREIVFRMSNKIQSGDMNIRPEE